MKNRVLRIVLSVLCLLIATVCYFSGIETGAVILLALAVIFEIAFWLGLFGRKRSRPSI